MNLLGNYMKKGLEKNSKYNKYDINNDGVVTEEELAIATSIKETDQVLRKQLAQLRIARATLIAMGLFTVAMFFVDIERLKALADISNLFYISGAGIVGAYMGASAFMSKK